MYGAQQTCSLICVHAESSRHFAVWSGQGATCGAQPAYITLISLIAVQCAVYNLIQVCTFVPNPKSCGSGNPAVA